RHERREGLPAAYVDVDIDRARLHQAARELGLAVLAHRNLRLALDDSIGDRRPLPDAGEGGDRIAELLGRHPLDHRPAEYEVLRYSIRWQAGRRKLVRARRDDSLDELLHVVAI